MNACCLRWSATGPLWVLVIALGVGGCPTPKPTKPPEARRRVTPRPGPAGPWTAVFASNHTCGIQKDRSLWCWGDNQNGQLGVGDKKRRGRPAKVDLGDVARVWMSEYHTCALDKMGALWCWGWGGQRRLGFSNYDDKVIPARFPVRGQVIDAALGYQHTCALLETGKVYCAGTVTHDKSGRGTYKPEPVPGLPEMKHIASHNQTLCGVSRAGELWCWGQPVGYTGAEKDERKPRKISGFEKGTVVEVGLGYVHACARLKDGSVWCWGRDERLHKSFLTKRPAKPLAPVVGARPATALSVGRFHACVLGKAQGLRCWGGNASGQLGDGTEGRGRLTLQPVAAPGKAKGGLKDVAAVAAGNGHTCAVTRRGALYCWGAAHLDQLGDNRRGDWHRPTRVAGLPTVRALAGDDNYVCAATKKGDVYCWGDNTWHAQGDSTRLQRPRPHKLKGLSRIVDVATSGWQVCALRADGRVLCWGLVTAGAERKPPFLHKRPALMPGLTNVTALTMGNELGCALQKSGRVLCWGDNQSGSLGDGTYISRANPSPVKGLTDAVAVHAKDRGACATRRTGQVVCWGYEQTALVTQPKENADGAPCHVTPTAVRGLSGAATAVVGAALRRDGSVWLWGGEDCPEEGPCSAKQLTDLRVDKAAVANHRLRFMTGVQPLWCLTAPKKDPVCWGKRDPRPQGKTTAKPRRIVLKGYRHIEAFRKVTYGLRADGALLTWGTNGSGQLGRGLPPVQLRPLRVRLRRRKK